MMLKYRLTALLFLLMMGISNISSAQSKATSKVTIDLIYEDADGRKHSETVEYIGQEAEDFDVDTYEKSLEKRDIKILNLNINQSTSTRSRDDLHEDHNVKIKRKEGNSNKSVTVQKIIVSDSDDTDTYNVEEKDGKIFLNGKEIDGDSKQIRIMKTMSDDDDMKVEVKDGKVFINGEEVDESDIHNSLQQKVIIKKMEDPEPGEYSDHVIIKKFTESDSDEVKNTWITKDGEEIGLENIEIKINEKDGKMIFISDDTPQKPRLGIMIEDGKAVNGAEIVDLVPESPAAKAGLQKGDTVTAINDQPIYGVTSMMAEVEDFESGDEVSITYSRNGKSMTSKIQLEMMNTKIEKRVIIREEKQQ